MIISKKAAKTINLSLEIISFMVICVLLLNKGGADPGDFIFLFVFENLVLFISFGVYFVMFNPWHSSYIRKIRGEQQSFKKSISDFFSILIGAGIAWTIAFFVLVFLDQLTVELLISYLGDNAFNFKSLDILARGGMFFEDSVIQEMGDLFQANYKLFFWIYGFKYFINLVVNLMAEQNLKTDENLTINGIFSIAVTAIIGPVFMFLVCVILVLLAAIFGPQTWIIWFTLITFKLGTYYVMRKFSGIVKSI